MRLLLIPRFLTKFAMCMMQTFLKPWMGRLLDPRKIREMCLTSGLVLMMRFALLLNLWIIVRGLALLLLIVLFGRLKHGVPFGPAIRVRVTRFRSPLVMLNVVGWLPQPSFVTGVLNVSTFGLASVAETELGTGSVGSYTCDVDSGMTVDSVAGVSGLGADD